MSRYKKLKEAQFASINSVTGQTLILEDTNNREFFRYERGELVEYDRTKSNGNLVRLFKYEVEEIECMQMNEPQITQD